MKPAAVQGRSAAVVSWQPGGSRRPYSSYGLGAGIRVTTGPEGFVAVVDSVWLAGSSDAILLKNSRFLLR